MMMMAFATPRAQPGRGYFIRLVFVFGCLCWGLLVPLVGAAQEARPRVDVVELDATITPVVARYVDRVIRQAEDDHRAAVVIELDTPGGLSSAMDDIIRDILDSEVPVMVYVTPRGARAASAGTFITYAAHVAAMAPGTNMGSASPVAVGGDDLNETMSRKVTNDAVAQIRNLATFRGRNADWAEKAVREAVNISAEDALATRVVDIVAPDVTSLLEQAHGRTVQMGDGSAVTLQTSGARTGSIEMSWFEQFMQLIADPTIAYLLVSLGSIGLFLELSNPGATVPGVVGGLALILGLFALGTLPVNWTGLLLMGFALLLFVIDLYVPSFGMLTIGGLISFVIGSYLLFGDNAPPGYEISPVVIWTVTACLVGFFVLLGMTVMRSQFRRPATGQPSLVGSVVRVRRSIEPDGGGMVYADGALWRAVQDEGTEVLPVGSAVVITNVQGLTLYVRPATEDEIASLERARGGAGERMIATT